MMEQSSLPNHLADIPERFTISDLETLRVVADSLRVRILEHLAMEPRTAKYLAHVLAIPQTKIYYHLNLLEQHNIVRIVSTRVVSGIIEKQYGPTARTFAVDKTLLSLGTDSDSTLDMMIDSFVGSIRDVLREGLASGLIIMDEDAPKNRQLMIFRSSMRLTPAAAVEFAKRLNTMLDELGQKDVHRADPEAQLQEVTIFVIPIADREAP